MRFTTKALLVVTICAAAFAQARAQGIANVPVRVTASQATTVTVSLTPPLGGSGTGVSGLTMSTGKDTTFALALGATSILPSSRMSMQRAQANIRHKRGNVTINLPTSHYPSASISLHSINGKRILGGKAAASDGIRKISRHNISAGVYILSVKGANGNSLSSRLSHGGGGLIIDAAFVGGTGKTDMQRSAKSAGAANLAQAWTISVTAAATYNATLSGKFVPKAGDNERITITFSSQGNTVSIPEDMEVDMSDPNAITPGGEGSGFEPEAMGMTPDSTCEGMRFAWYSTGSSSSPKLRVYSENDEVITEVTGVSGAASTGKRSNKAVVRGLEPNTVYKYSVTNDGAEWSKKYRFRTPPPLGQPFRFVALGDPQIDHNPDNLNPPPNPPDSGTTKAWMKSMAKINAHAPSFIMSAGDQVDNMGNAAEYLDVFAPPELRHIPFAPTMGNHDWTMGNSPVNTHYNLPNARPLSSSNFDSWHLAANYWFLYNNILFVMPNTGWLYDTTAATARPMVEAQVKRYDSLLTAAKTKSAGKYDWIIVVHHRSTRSLGPHSMTLAEYASNPTIPRDPNMQWLKEAGFEDTTDKHGVDLVIAGHDHIYVRSKTLKGGQVVPAGQGTVYLTVLPAGSHKFYPLMSTASTWGNTDWIEKSYPATTSYQGWDRKHAYVLFDVNGKRINATVLNVDGVIRDEFTFSK